MWREPTGIHLLDCALSVNEIKGLPAIPEDVCWVRQRLQKLQQDQVKPEFIICWGSTCRPVQSLSPREF